MRKQCLVSLLHLLMSLLALAAVAEPAALATSNEAVDKVQQWQDTINQLEQESETFSIEMVESLKSYALVLAKAGHREEAIETLRRAQHILHRHHGVHTPQQLNLIHQMVAISLTDQDYLNADQLQGFIFYLTDRTGDLDSKIAAHKDLADWYLRSGQFKRATTMVKKAIELIESSGDNQHQELIPLLLNQALYRQMAGLCCNRKYLERAQQIAESSLAATDIKDEIQLRLADASILEGKQAKAVLHWQNLSKPVSREPGLITGRRQFNDPEEMRKEYYQVSEDPMRRRSLYQMTPQQRRNSLNLPPQFFMVNNNSGLLPIMIRDGIDSIENKEKLTHTVGSPFVFLRDQLEQILPLRLRRTEGLNTLKLVLTYTVTDQGRVKDIRIEGEAPRALKKLLRDTLSTSRYHPALQASRPVTTLDVSITQTFTIDEDIKQL